MVLFTALAASLLLIGTANGQVCGTCNPTQPGMLNVHLIPHSHDDVGWLKTVDEYYLGSNRDGWTGWEEIQIAGVQYVLDSVVRELAFDETHTKRFIQVETAFFWRWWRQQDALTRELVEVLVANGQLEFTNGGWSMNDEGATHYSAIVDNMAMGLRKLNETFGDCGVPRVAWQIDPFGHSREQGSLFAQMGFDGLFFGRLDWRDKTKREQEKSLEMLWSSSEDLGASSDLFTGVLFNFYGPPGGFCYDIMCNDTPLKDDPEASPDYNVDAIVDAFIAEMQDYASVSASGEHIMVTMGMDFHYQAAQSWFMNMDKLIQHTNLRQNSSGSTVNVLYSTPSCYVEALNGQQGLTFPNKTDDFFPYASDPHAYWTGYFSSRPTSKRLMREGNQVLQVAKQETSAIHLKSGLTDTVKGATDRLEEAVGIVQHHDAITGTEKQAVTYDYDERIHRGIHDYVDSTYGTERGSFQYCHLLNISQCDVSEVNSEFTISVYNPLGRTRNSYVRVPVIGDSWTVTEATTSADVEIQLIPIIQAIRDIPGRSSNATHELLFRAEDLPPLGTKFYYARESSFRDLKQLSRTVDIPEEGLKFGGKSLNSPYVFINGKTQEIEQIGRAGQVDNPWMLQYMWYEGHRGDNMVFENRASGAYIFRPTADDPEILLLNTDSNSNIEGNIVNEAYQSFKDDEGKEYVSHVVRVYHGESNPLFDTEVEWLVGPIPIDDDKGREIIYRAIFPDINHAETFYTDANGRQMMERIRGFRPTYEINGTEPVAQNYYPVNSRISITDPGVGTATILNDRSQAGGSIHEHEMELLIHRRLLDDDAFGVGEALNEEAFGVGLVARGKLFVQFNNDTEEAREKHRLFATELYRQPFITLAAGIVDGVSQQPLLAEDLPMNVHLLTMEPWWRDDHSLATKHLLLRFEHLFQKGESSTWSEPASVDLAHVLSNLGTVVSVRETTLGANQFLPTSRDRLSWDGRDNRLLRGHAEDLALQEDFILDLQPFEIRTIIVEFA